MLELAIKNFEQDYASTRRPIGKSTSYNNQIPKSASSSSLSRSQFRSKEISPDSSSNDASSFNSTRILKASNEAFLNDEHFRKGLNLLREQLLRANALVREANSLCKEMNRPIRFSITMQIPAYNLTPFRKVFEI